MLMAGWTLKLRRTLFPVAVEPWADTSVWGSLSPEQPN